VAVLLLMTSTLACRRARETPAPVVATTPARYVGRAECVRCHEREDALWRGSHHDLAMQVADTTTVLGDFADRRFSYGGLTSTFFRRDGKYLVHTDGPDGRLHDYEIAYTFGVFPLQQYLIAFPGGRYQALNICWDARPAAVGGQRWFHLYPNEKVDHAHPFHWTGPYQNWNFMCAECHSTNVRKGYHAGEDRYETSWSEIDVSCEACHGPASGHLAWAAARTDDPRKGFTFALGDPSPRAEWIFDPARGIAHRATPRTSSAEIETCARCHARRAPISATYVHGRPLLDTHRPALLDAALYYADGQILDEDYEYGSFLQSRMHAQGVTCSDCHDPHSLQVASVPGDACTRCHQPQRFASPAHHFHKVGSRGASCVACHMPTRNYMVIHPRHDHSLRVPRPDLTLKIGTPNACNACHADRSARWAAAAAERFWGTSRPSQPHYGEALHAGRELLPNAEPSLVALADDTAKPGIVRATAVSMLGGWASSRSLPSIERSLGNPDPLLRLAGVEALAAQRERAPALVPLLADPVRGVRIAAARALAVADVSLLPEQRRQLDAGIAEWTATQDANADRAEAHLNLGALFAERGQLERARAECETALRLNRWLGAVYVNLADLARLSGDEAEAQRVLRHGLEIAPDDADLHEALGLALVRARRPGDALQQFGRAAELGRGEPHFAYVYAMALHDADRVAQALGVLRATLERHPGDPEVLLALVNFSRETGASAEAAAYERRLAEVAPDGANLVR
jgi:tetratricopeptide (TPR) repeat protein